MKLMAPCISIAKDIHRFASYRSSL